MKTRRLNDPRSYVLLEEVNHGGSSSGSRSNPDSSGSTKSRGSSSRVETRLLGDDDNVYAVQRAWQANAGKFTLAERSKAMEVLFKMINTLIIYKCREVIR